MLFITTGVLPNNVSLYIVGPALHVQGDVQEALKALRHQSGTTGQLLQGSMAALLNSTKRVLGHSTLHRYRSWPWCALAASCLTLKDPH
jgi:hypothetical protein